LTGYRRAVALALDQASRGHADAAWGSLESKPADLLPSDPDWAGDVVYTDVRTAVTGTAPDDIWPAAEKAASDSRWFPIGPRRDRSVGRWHIAEREPGSRLRLQADVRSPGTAWLEITVTPQEHGGSRYTQRATVFPRGIRGRVYWRALRPLHSAALRALARNAVGVV
jgi:hypothetical protein